MPSNPAMSSHPPSVRIAAAAVKMILVEREIMSKDQKWAETAAAPPPGSGDATSATDVPERFDVR